MAWACIDCWDLGDRSAANAVATIIRVRPDGVRSATPLCQRHLAMETVTWPGV